MSTIQIIYIASVCVVYVITNLIYIITAFKKASTSKKVELLKSTILAFMEEAEKFKNYTGEEKYNFVFTRVKEFTNKTGLKIKDEEINTLVESFIKFSNNVNINKRGAK